MEEKKKSKIKKWNEVTGVVEEEVVENVSSPDATTDPVISRDQNPLKSVEDMVEQNDNSLDGIINNMPEVKPAAQMTSKDVIEEEQKKKSILKMLHDSLSAEERKKTIIIFYPISDKERL